MPSYRKIIARQFNTIRKVFRGSQSAPELKSPQADRRTTYNINNANMTAENMHIGVGAITSSKETAESAGKSRGV